VGQVGEAVTQMDRATQQNAALVEESAAAAESMKAQAEQLVQAVAAFRLVGQAVRQPATNASVVERRGPDRATNVVRPAFANKPAARTSAAAEPARESKRLAATGTDDWETF